MAKLTFDNPQDLTRYSTSTRPICKQAGLALFLKRSLDLSVAAAALILFAPLMVLVAVIIYATMGAPVLFLHLRPGKHGRPFTLLKFRTMSDRRDSSGRLLADGERLTRIGRFLRSTSLDELPQLINVLLGDMSLVGPRPLCMQYLERYSQCQARRHDVMPGITGLAQVKGRNALSWNRRLALDVWYVDHWTILLDLTIMWLTVMPVLHRSGVTEPGHATMTEFTGTHQSRSCAVQNKDRHLRNLPE